MIIMGIDPGVATTGFAIIKVLSNNKYSIIDYGCIKTRKDDIFSQRLLEIHQELREKIKKYEPNKIAIESIYFAKNMKTAMKVGEAWGVAVLAAAEERKQVFEFTPLQIKQALTGYGRASKQQIQKMVKTVFNLKNIPRPDDAADALAAAICCAQTKKLWGQ